MKILTIIFILLILQISENLSIKEIKANYSKIKASLDGFQKETKNLLDVSPEGGTATFYTDKTGKIVLVIAELFFESGKILGEYYFKNDTLFFVYTEEHHYNVPFYVDSTFVKENGGETFDPKKTKIEQQRFYFSNDKLIQWLDVNSKPVKKNDTYNQKEKEILDFCKILLK